VNKVRFVNCGQSGCHFHCNFQGQLYVKPTGAFDKIVDSDTGRSRRLCFAELKA